MKKFAVIVAGGSGQRMGASVPKQFLLLKGKPLLYYTLTTFLKSYNDLHIILVLPKEHNAIGTEIVEAINGMERIQLVEGGVTRFHSVQNGLKHITANSVVFVHDGVRCVVEVDLIHHCYEQTLLKGIDIPAVGVRVRCSKEQEQVFFGSDHPKRQK
jgi:2-C-methyl-D-erythritol 4-phosphate cytidylyltransferase